MEIPNEVRKLYGEPEKDPMSNFKHPKEFSDYFDSQNRDKEIDLNEAQGLWDKYIKNPYRNYNPYELDRERKDWANRLFSTWNSQFRYNTKRNEALRNALQHSSGRIPQDELPRANMLVGSALNSTITPFENEEQLIRAMKKAGIELDETGRIK